MPPRPKQPGFRQQVLAEEGLDLAPVHAKRLFWSRFNNDRKPRKALPTTVGVMSNQIVGESARLNADLAAQAFRVWDAVVPEGWKERIRLDSFTGGTFHVLLDGASSAYAFRRQMSAALLGEIKRIAPHLGAKWIDCRVGNVRQPS